MNKKVNKYRRTKITRGEPPNFSGQHLMHNKKLISEIISLGEIEKRETVLDLGAGKGALTSSLIHKAGRVLAVEYDSKFIAVLKENFDCHSNINIIHQDILKIHLPKEPFVVISNIPYAITTPIMMKLLNNPLNYFQRGVIVMEKGAAKRFTSNYVKDPYVIAWRMWFDIRYVKGISRKNFSPPPKVDSAMVKINRKANPIVPYSDYLVFWGLVDYVLKNPQLSLDYALRGAFTVPQIKRLKRNLRLKKEIPVAELTEEQWGILYETMVKHVPKFRWPRIRKEKLNHYRRQK
ncbi:MAG: 23S ribosomal RNA methyltransferase Erm [Epulopiscium sp.]|nr:23S ribosomal RNA methyltransferase Erm [Candidatus Epulonipiscium sp.]